MSSSCKMVPDQELPPSPEQLASLRQSFLEMVKERGKDLFEDMIKFCTKANVTEFLDTEGLPKELGGEDDWQYSWQPEQRLQPEIPNEDESRSWTVSPSDRLVFRTKADAAGGEMETTLTVANRSTTAPLAYKVRSTRPALFLVS